MYKHLHYSSIKERLDKLRENPDYIFYQCKPCGRTHLISDGERISLIIMSTLLFEWFKYKENCREEVHIDYIQMAGARIANLFLALRQIDPWMC